MTVESAVYDGRVGCVAIYSGAFFSGIVDEYAVLYGRTGASSVINTAAVRRRCVVLKCAVYYVEVRYGIVIHPCADAGRITVYYRKAIQAGA